MKNSILKSYKGTNNTGGKSANLYSALKKLVKTPSIGNKPAGSDRAKYEQSK